MSSAAACARFPAYLLKRQKICVKIGAYKTVAYNRGDNMTYHLAIDIGASSGRHILGYIEDGKIRLEEVYRFEDYLKADNGSLIWDIEKLVREVKAGIAKCGKLGKIPATIAIDTWGVDYVLLDENKQELLPCYSYRDNRNNLIQDEVAAIIPQEELYEKTGIQKANYNTVYQLYCDKKSGKLDKAKYFLMMPDYLAFKLTGEIKNVTKCLIHKVIIKGIFSYIFKYYSRKLRSKLIFCFICK